MTPADAKSKKTKGTGPVRKGGGTPRGGAGIICPECRADNNADSRFCSRCAAPLGGRPSGGGESGARTVRASTVELARGNRLAGRYEIIEELGRGGMGKVFKAFDHKINEVIALKLIRPEISVQDKAIERFKNELKFTRKITHRNICRMYDLGEEDCVFYITMEYVAGEDLKRFVKRAGPLNAGKAVVIAGQICDGLTEAHRIGAVHRDLKPQNIMIDHEGNAKIMDFGIARFTEMDRMTGSGVMIGTPEYMSPEQAEVKEVDARSDLYSLGVVLFEMVTGKVPFEGETPLSLAMKHKLEIPRNVRDLNPLVPAGLAAVISRCLEKDPSRRFASAQDLKKALEEAETGFSTGERAVSPPAAVAAAPGAASASRSKKPFPLIPAVAAAVIIAAAAVVGYLLFFRPGAPTDNPADAGAGAAAGAPAGISAAVSGEGAPPAAGENAAAKPAGLKRAAAETKPAESKAKPAAPPVSDKKAPGSASGSGDRSVADLPAARMNAARAYALQKRTDTASGVFLAAEGLNKEGAAALSRNQFNDARCAFAVADKLYRIFTADRDDDGRIKEMVKYLGKLRRDATAAWNNIPADPLFRDAQDRGVRGDAAWSAGDLPAAAREYAAAAFDYEKIVWAVESARKK